MLHAHDVKDKGEIKCLFFISIVLSLAHPQSFPSDILPSRIAPDTMLQLLVGHRNKHSRMKPFMTSCSMVLRRIHVYVNLPFCCFLNRLSSAFPVFMAQFAVVHPLPPNPAPSPSRRPANYINNNANTKCHTTLFDSSS